MATAKGRNKFMFDAEASITLRDVGDGAETATATEAAVTLNTLTDAYWDDNEIPFDSRHGADVVVQVAAMDTTDGDETYTISVEVADDEAFGTNVAEVASHTVAGVGVFSMKIDPEAVEALVGTAKFIRVKATLGGTSPSITYGAWIS